LWQADTPLAKNSAPGKKIH